MLHSGGNRECNNTDFGDKRLDKRMAKMLEQIIEKPNTSVPQSSDDVYQAKACYRFWDNAKVKPDRILKHHIRETIKEASQQGVILAVQDTTELDFSSHKHTVGLGYLETLKQSGIKVHTALAISTCGQLLGLLWQKQWVRPLEEYGKKAQRKKKPTEEKESYRWLECHNDINESMPKESTIIHITDREGDEIDLLGAPRADNHKLLIRFAQDRCVEGEPHRIKAALDAQPIAGKFNVIVGRKGLLPPREIELNIKYQTFNIKTPANRIKDLGSVPTRITAIKAYEENPEPASKEVPKVEWYLLTTLPVTKIEDIQQYVKYYSMRWLIERYHYTLKSGCQVEELQLETAGRLENAVATYCVAAYRIMYMNYLARTAPDLDAHTILTNDEYIALKLKYGNNNTDEIITVKTAVIWVARLGGFLARKSDGMPGVKTLWRGLLALEYLVQGYQIAMNSLAKLSKNDDSSPFSPFPRTYG
jgi:hypothetical protein